MIARLGSLLVTLAGGLVVTSASSGAPAAARCSMGPPWTAVDTGELALIATASADSARAGPGAIRSTGERGHFGEGLPRDVFGQRFAVERLSEQAARRLSPATREVVLVPWDYSASCAPVTWTRSALWVEPGLSGLYLARLRASEDWSGGVPTFDVLVPEHQPYPHRLGRAFLSPSILADSLLPVETLVDILDSPRFAARGLDTLGTRSAILALRDLGMVADRYPVTGMIEHARRMLEVARLLAISPSIRGTWELTVGFPDGSRRPLYLRTDVRLTAEIHDLQAERPRDPLEHHPLHGYTMYAAGVRAESDLPSSCRGIAGELDYIDVEHRPPYPPYPTRPWRCTLYDRLLEVTLTPTERQALARFRLAQRDVPQPVIPLDSIVIGVVAAWALQFTPRGNELTVDGTVELQPFGTLTVSGRRTSLTTIDCQDIWP
jgi:hypothetical protein